MTSTPFVETALHGLLPALGWLDAVLGAAEAEHGLGRQPGAQLVRERVPREAPARGTPLERIAAAHGLSEFDIDVLLLALAPELDRRYERVYAQLQDLNPSGRPTVDLALRLFARDAV